MSPKVNGLNTLFLQILMTSSAFSPTCRICFFSTIGYYEIKYKGNQSKGGIPTYFSPDPPGFDRTLPLAEPPPKVCARTREGEALEGSQ